MEGVTVVRWSDAGDYTDWSKPKDTGSACLHCMFGLVPVRLRRRWVHHFADTGTIVVCEEANLKPSA